MQTKRLNPWLQVALAGAAAWASGCAAPLSRYYLEPDTQPPEACPARTHLVGIGSSREGAAAAEQLARADVSRKIATQLEAEFRAEQQESVVSANGTSSVLSAEQRAQLVRETTTFAHAELAKRKVAPEEKDGLTYVLVCLGRKEAAERLLEDLRPQVERVRAAEGRTRAAKAAGDRPGFAGGWRELQGLWKEARPQLAQVRALVGRSELEQAWDRTRAELAAEAEAQRRSLAFRLEVKGGDLPDDVHSNMTDVFGKALTLLGPVRGAGACTAGGSELAVTVAARANCRRGSIGHACRPDFTLRVEDCSGKAAPAETNLAGTDLSGADPTDSVRALRKALSPLTPERAHSELRAVVSTLAPL